MRLNNEGPAYLISYFQVVVIISNQKTAHYSLVAQQSPCKIYYKSKILHFLTKCQI